MFCKNCGNQLNSGDNFCTKCGASIEKNVTINNISSNANASNRKKVSFFKTYLKLCGILIAFWFVMAIIRIVINVIIASQNNGVIQSSGVVDLLGQIQRAISIYGMVYGWIPVLIYTGIKNSK